MATITQQPQNNYAAAAEQTRDIVREEIQQQEHQAPTREMVGNTVWHSAHMIIIIVYVLFMVFSCLRILADPFQRWNAPLCILH